MPSLCLVLTGFCCTPRSVTGVTEITSCVSWFLNHVCVCACACVGCVYHRNMQHEAQNHVTLMEATASLSSLNLSC